MDTSQVVQLIGSLGFPIVACGAMFWYMVTEMKELREVVNNNTIALTKIFEHLSGGESQ